MPKCEIFHLFDFNDFYGIKSLQVGDLRAEIKFFFFFFKCGPDTYHFILASVCAVYASNDFFDFELEQKIKLFQIPLRST